jgi:hypothetical protein
MLTLAILLQVAGLIGLFAFGAAGYVLGPLAILAGALLLLRELRHRRQFAADGQPVPRRSGGKRFLIGLSAVMAGFCALFALVWILTSGLADTADGFFRAMKAGDLPGARQYLAEDFLASTSDEDLRRFIESSALANYESASWSSRSIENSRGKLSGTVNTASGGSVPMDISLVREKGAWKILALSKPSAGLLGDTTLNAPNSADQTRLVRQTTSRFADAVTREDFTQFRHSSAALWQRQITAEKLAEGFKGFAPAAAELQSLANAEPQIDTAKFDDDGAYTIAGGYPVSGGKFQFRYRYLYEGTDWKLVGINADLR